MNNDELLELIHTDPLLIAEGLTGKSYKEDEDTKWAGFALHQQKAKIVEAALTARGDTTFRNDLARYQDIVENYGFELVRTIDFLTRDYAESQFTYWHREHGLVLVFDTYQTTQVNGGKVYYAWKPSTEDRWQYTSSGCFEGNVWVGDHDCREALILNMENLRTHGDFVTPWPLTYRDERPRVWFAHHGDTNTSDDWQIRSAEYDRIDQERFDSLPEDMRIAMGGA